MAWVVAITARAARALLKVSYDLTRALDQDENAAFAQHWKAATAPDKFEVTPPPPLILAEPPFAVVNKNIDKKGSSNTAEACLAYLYSAEGKVIVGKPCQRPRDAKIAAALGKQVAPVKLFTIDEVYGGCRSAQKTHVYGGRAFDQICAPGR